MSLAFQCREDDANWHFDASPRRRPESHSPSGHKITTFRGIENSRSYGLLYLNHLRLLDDYKLHQENWPTFIHAPPDVTLKQVPEHAHVEERERASRRHPVLMVSNAIVVTSLALAVAQGLTFLSAVQTSSAESAVAAGLFSVAFAIIGITLLRVSVAAKRKVR